jgi:hypothetical protein
MTKNATIRAVLVVLASIAIFTAMPVQAASRLGGQTDDSVCDVGKTWQRVNGVPATGEFVRTSCKNGQLLMGVSVAPAGDFDSEIVVLARTLCRIADIQTRRNQGDMGGIVMEYDEVRCKIEKLPK